MRLFSVLAVPAVTLFMAAPLAGQEAAEAADQAEDAAHAEAADHAEHAEGAEHGHDAMAEGPDFEAMYASYTAAFNAGDLDGVLSHYAAEATAMFQGGPATTGHAEMAPRFEELFAIGAQLAIHPGEQHVMGHMAVDQGHYVLTMEVEGETVTNSGYWMGFLHEHDDGWKFVRLVSNSDQEM